MKKKLIAAMLLCATQINGMEMVLEKNQTIGKP